MWQLLILAFIGVVTAKNGTFLILAPKAISPAMHLRIGVNSLNDSTDLTVTARVQTQEWSNYPYYHYEQIYVDHANETQTILGGQAGIIEVQIPQDLKSDQYILNIQVNTGSGDEHIAMYSLHYYNKYLSVFIQTDKAIYKPGSLVNFRTFSVYSDLLTYTGNTTVEIYDPNNNKLKFTQNVSDPTGVITNSFKLSAMPILGHWKIKVIIPGGPSEEKTFEVSNYKLPRFEVTVDMPNFALVTDHDIRGKVVSKYTFGEPVKGVAEIHAKIANSYSGSCSSEQPSILMSFPIDGEGKFTIPMEEVTRLKTYLNGQELEVQAFVTETLTGKKLNGSASLTFYTESVKITYLDYSTHNFKPGLTYKGTLKVALQNGLPLPTPRKDITIYPCVTYRTRVQNQARYHSCSTKFEGTYGLGEQTYPVPADGLVDVKINIPSDAVEVTITAYYGDTSYTSWTVNKAYSPSETFLQLEVHDTNITAGDSANIVVNSTEPLGTVWYEVISRGSFVMVGNVDVGLTKTFNLTLPITAKMAPHAHVLVYTIRDDGEVVADSTDFEVQGLFTNKVSVEFNRNESQPHENVNVLVKADPQSLVSLLVVDKSVNLLASGNDITSDMVKNELKYYDSRGVTSTYKGETDATEVFLDASINVYTDGIVPTNSGDVVFGQVTQTQRPNPTTFVPYPGATPYPGPTRYPIGYLPSPGATPYLGPTPFPIGYTAAPGATPYPGPSRYPIAYTPSPGATPYLLHGSVGGQGLKQVDHVRKFFPETWLWTNTTTSADGTSTISAMVPDTVTSWIASAFAVNPVTGLGVTTTKSRLKVFRPFFVSVDVPMSVIRGEQVVVQASVFNYLLKDLEVMVTMTKSDDYANLEFDPTTASLQALSADQTKTIHVPSNGALTVDFPIVPKKLGQLTIKVSAQSPVTADAVERKLTVEAEGIRKETNFPVTIDLLSNNVFNKTVAVPLPNYIVKDSQRARVRAFGDVISPSLDGLDGLLKLPTGCGEQNMMGLAPDVYISNYLISANKFTGQIEARVMPFMEEGYQRELRYQHYDGSFSAWGNQDYRGSTWLTAFVVKTFAQARQYIYIDDDIIARAANFLLGKQHYAGDYYEEGNNIMGSSMQGGSGHGYALTAYVLDALLEVKGLEGINAYNLNDSITRARAYLEFNIMKYDDSYTIAITTYVLTKAASIFADDDFKKMEHAAIKKDDVMYWERNNFYHSSYWRPSHQTADAIDIETAGYALKTYALRNDFVRGLPVMKWLTSMRNPKGGYISTQDTVVALDGLAAFAAIISSGAYKVSTDVTSGTFTKHFDINENNAIHLQAVDATQFTGKFNIQANGHGIGYVEFAVFFNVEKAVEEQFFDISQDVELEALNMFTLRTCVRYSKSPSNNMAVVEITIPSGFEPDMETIGSIRNLQRTEQMGKNLVFYFSNLDYQNVCIRFTSRRNGKVAKIQASPIRAYDYYEPTHQGVTFYHPKILQDSTICDICADCCQKVTTTP